MESVQERRQVTWRALPRRAIRFVLYWLIKLVVLGVYWGWRRKAVTAIVLAAGLLTWWIGSATSLPPVAPTQVSAGAAKFAEQFSTSVTASAPASAAEQYLRGQSQYDARSMWDAVSDEMKRAMTARSGGLTLQRLEQQLDDARKNGVHYDEVGYVGGYRAPDGRGFYLYVIAVNSGGDTKYVPYTFTISKEGKILSID